MRVPIVLIGLALLWYLFIHAGPMAAHLFDAGWPDHARNHLLRAMILGSGAALLGFAILLGPFRRREPWAWWAMAWMAVFTMGGFWIGAALVDFGLAFEWRVASIGFGIATVLFVLGLALTHPWRSIPAGGGTG